MDISPAGTTGKKDPMDLEIGTPLFFRVEGYEPSPEGLFVGERAGRYIVVRLRPPALSSDSDLMGTGDMTLFYLSGGMVHEFETRLVRVVSDPVELIILQYPRDVRIRELRAHKRISCFVSADIQVKNMAGKDPLNGVIADISKKGCRCLFHRRKGEGPPFSLEEEVVLSFIFPGVAGRQEALGRVRNIRVRAERLVVGIEFTEIMWWAPPYE